MHEIDPIIQGFGFVLKSLFFDKQTAESVDPFAFNLVRKTPGRTCMLTEPRSDAVIVQICELGLDAPAVLAVAGDPEMGALCLKLKVLIEEMKAEIKAEKALLRAQESGMTITM